MTDYLQLIRDSLIFFLPLSYNSSLTLTFLLSLCSRCLSLCSHCLSLCSKRSALLTDPFSLSQPRSGHDPVSSRESPLLTLKCTADNFQILMSTCVPTCGFCVASKIKQFLGDSLQRVYVIFLPLCYLLCGNERKPFHSLHS